MAEPTTSRISVLIGEEIGSNQQSELTFQLVGGKGFTTYKMEAFQTIASEKEFDLQNALVVTLPCSQENQDALIEKLDLVLTGKSPIKQLEILG